MDKEDQQPKTETPKKCKTVIIISHNAFSSASSTGKHRLTSTGDPRDAREMT